MQSSSSLRIVVCDDHAIVRSGLLELLGSITEFECVAEAEHGIEAITAVKKHQPNLMFLDVSMPYAGGLEVIGEIRQWSPDTRIVVFTGVATSGVMNELIQAEVDGILLKSCGSEEMQRGLQTIVEGNPYICDEANRLASDSATLSSLTSRERQVLHQVVMGASNADIAERFNISPKTVDNHRTNLMRKLDVHSIGGLIQVAMREGLITTADVPSE